MRGATQSKGADIYVERAAIQKMVQQDAEPIHGQGGWELAKYEWKPDGSARFLYTRDAGGGVIERREVRRDQKGWAI